MPGRRSACHAVVPELTPNQVSSPPRPKSRITRRLDSGYGAEYLIVLVVFIGNIDWKKLSETQESLHLSAPLSWCPGRAKCCHRRFRYHRGQTPIGPIEATAPSPLQGYAFDGSQLDWIGAMSQSFSSTSNTAAAPGTCGVSKAENDYYDCMARFGHDSAEAHVAERLWRQARSDRAQASGRQV